MTVGELIAMLEEFPPNLPVYFCPDFARFSEAHRVIVPLDAVMNLVHLGRGEAMSFPYDGQEASDISSEGYMDALVIYPVSVREGSASS